MHLREWAVPGARGEPVLRRVVAPDEACRPAVVLVHGAGESAAVHQAFARTLAARGLRVELLDLPGFGRSAGGHPDARRGGGVERFDELTAAVSAALDDARAASAGRAALLGHSLGALVAAACAAARPGAVAALALSSAPLAGLRDPGAVVTPLLAAELERAVRALDRVSPFCPGLPVLALFGARDEALVRSAAGWLAAHGRSDALVEVVPDGPHNLLAAPGPSARAGEWLAALLDAAALPVQP